MIVGQFGSFIGQFLEAWKGTIEEDDIFITNDPYSVGGSISHLNDWLVLMPVFTNGKLSKLYPLPLRSHLLPLLKSLSCLDCKLWPHDRQWW
jgi:hypothetical protein